MHCIYQGPTVFFTDCTVQLVPVHQLARVPLNQFAALQHQVARLEGWTAQQYLTISRLYKGIARHTRERFAAVKLRWCQRWCLWQAEEQLHCSLAVCMFGACHAHAECWCLCSLGAVVTNSDSNNKQHTLVRSMLEDVWCRLPSCSDTLSSREESNQL